MISIAKLSDTEREVLFANSAERAGISNPAIVEKDFWVCFVLNYLFHQSPWPRSFIFNIVKARIGAVKKSQPLESILGRKKEKNS